MLFHWRNHRPSSNPPVPFWGKRRSSPSLFRKKRVSRAPKDVSRLNVTYYFNGPSIPITVAMRDNPLPPSLSLRLSFFFSYREERKGKGGIRRYITWRVTRRYGRARAEKVRVDTCGQSTCIKLTPRRTSTCSRVRECSKARHGH